MISRILTLLFLLPISCMFSDNNFDKKTNLKNANASKQYKKNDKNKANQKEEEETNLELLDEIVSEITYTASDNIDTIVLTQSQVEQRGFDGNVYNVSDLENQKLLIKRGELLKAKSLTNDEINRNLKKNGMTEKDIINIAQRWGYLNKDVFFEALKEIYMASEILNYEVASQLVASREEIVDFYNNSEYIEEARYFVETAFVEHQKTFELKDDEANIEKEKIKNELQSYIRGEISKPDYVNWEAPVEITQSEISRDNQFLTTLSIGSIFFQEEPNGFVLYKMKNKIPLRIIPISEVQDAIAMKIKKDKYPAVVEKVKNKLREQAIIVHPNECFNSIDVE